MLIKEYKYVVLSFFIHSMSIFHDAEPEKINFNAPAIRKEFLSKFDKYNILTLW